MNTVQQAILFISTTVILIFVAFLFFNLELIPCQLQCRDKQPATSCAAPGCAGPYMACMDSCTGIAGSTTTPHCFRHGDQDYCANNRLNLLLIKLGLLLRTQSTSP